MSLFAGKRIVDLTRVLEPGAEPFKLNVQSYFVDELLPQFHRREGEWYILQEWEISSHVGTHIESPHHHIKEGGDVSTLDIGQLMADAVVMDFRHKRAGEAITRDEVREAGRDIVAGDIALIQTGFDRLYGQPDYDRPYVSFEAVQWLVEQGIGCIGIDASGIEKYKAEAQPSHLLLFQHRIPIIEELTNLDQLRHGRVFFMALPIPIRGADACPVRAVAIEEA